MRLPISLLLGAVLAPSAAGAFDSGSTGADGALNPNVNTEVQVPPSGVFNYSSIEIPAGVRVTFRQNATNTPVTLLVSGDALIAGILDLSGANGADSNGAGDGNIADDGLPGRGGPGGYPGGRGGMADPSSEPGTRRGAAAGVGPGGGRPTTLQFSTSCDPGNGASFATAGWTNANAAFCGSTPAPTYGNVSLLPLVGGSGGAGGHGVAGIGGAGGGGGGGALLIAVSGTLNVTGQVLANGGRGARVGNANASGGAAGGGGSGGAIRLVATTLAGNGTISAIGGYAGGYNNQTPSTFQAGAGYIRLEADFLQRTAQTTPQASVAPPGPLFIDGMPSLRVASVAGQAAPAAPTGYADIVLPTDAPNPVQVVIETVNVPLGNTVSIIVNPPSGTPVTVVSNAIAGSLASGTATASVDLPQGPSVLLATLSYTVTGQQALALSALTNGEPVVAVELAAAIGAGPSLMTLITESGRRHTVPAPVL